MKRELMRAEWADLNDQNSLISKLICEGEEIEKVFPIQDVTDAELIFSANVGRLMPKYEQIPAEFKRFGANKWERIADQWFCRGLEGARFAAKPGVDERRVMRHLSTIIQSYEPTHEHKIAAVAYLMSEWFDDIQMGKGLEL